MVWHQHESNYGLPKSVPVAADKELPVIESRRLLAGLWQKIQQDFEYSETTASELRRNFLATVKIKSANFIFTRLN